MKVRLPFLLLCFIISVMAGCYTQNKNTESAVAKTNDSTVSDIREYPAPVAKEDSAKFISTTLTVKGDVRYPLVLNVDSLKKMKTVALDSFNIVCQSGAVMSQNIKSRGVLLKDILEKASIIQQDHKDRNFYIVARATDGYKATFSWGEIFNNPAGENTYVLFEENGKPIGEKGSMILNCTNDITTGPRHVIWLNSIEVHRVK